MLSQFFITGELPANVIQGQYDILFVFAACIIATIGAFIALTLTVRMSQAMVAKERHQLHLAGAVALGSGFWSMHFISMLAYEVDIKHSYNIGLTVLSGIIAIATSWFVLKISQSAAHSWKRGCANATVIGLAISLMHYVGMASIQMDAELRYLPGLFTLSIVMAVVGSGATLWAFFMLGQRVLHRQLMWRALAAAVMGLGICAVHYVGMTASVIIPLSGYELSASKDSQVFEAATIGITGLIFVLSLMVAVVNRLAILVASAAIFSLPLFVIVYQAINGVNEDMVFAQREQHGNVYHREMVDLLISLQTLRGMVNVTQNTINPDVTLLAAQQKNVRYWISEVDAVDKKYGQELDVQQEWFKAKDLFNHLLEDHTMHDHALAKQEFAQHSLVIRNYMATMERVVDKSNLNTDPKSDSNLVADVLYNLMAETMETLGQLRGLAMGSLASRDHQPVQWTDEEEQRIEALYSHLSMLDGLIENRLIRSAELVESSQSFVKYHAANIKPQLDVFMQRYKSMIFTRKTDWSAQTVYADATEIIQSYDVLYDNMSEALFAVLEQRQHELGIRKNLVLVSSVIGFFGFVALFSFLFRSLTNTEHAEREARHAKRTAELAAAAKSDFLANMSHELRTPMNGVLGMANLLEETELDEEQKQYVSTITGSGENLLMLLNDILDFSKIEAGVLTLERIAYPIKDTINYTMNLLHLQADVKAVDLHMECEPEVPEYLWGDPSRLRQIIINLAGNAIKFTDNGRVRLTVRMQERANGSYLHISVEDTGIGIAADKLASIFDKFTQADASVTRKFGGTGLGLAITKQLVGLMGGQIGVESVLGKGSTFWFVIPCEAATAADILASTENMGQPVQGQFNKMPLSEARILLVEDYPVNQIFAQKILRKFGAQHIDLAEDGAMALSKFYETPYDMIFMDCQMPKMDGYLTTEEIRMIESLSTRHTPIVAMTANAMMGDREKCLKAGMDDYLSKPLRAAHLRKVLETWFLLDAEKSAITKTPSVVVKEAEEIAVDMTQLRVFTDGDPEEEKALFSLFMEQAQAMIDILEGNVGADGNEAWKSAAHRFKGSSGNLGAMKLHHLCRRAEMHFDDIEPKKLEMLAAIKAETLRVEKFFHAEHGNA